LATVAGLLNTFCAGLTHFLPQPEPNGYSMATMDGVMEAPRPVPADELLGREIPEPKWVIPGVLPEGGALKAGKPKVGKSWLTLGLAIAVASGGRALGAIPVEQGEVLYLGLEDNDRRMQSRLRLILGGDQPPKALHVATEWPRMHQGGLEAIEAWLAEHSLARLVVIDTFARIRAPRTKGANLYDEDYAAGAALKALADKYQVAILVIHHTRKMPSDDLVDTISGSIGIAAAMDTLLILRRERGRHDAALFVTGRDVEEQDIALKWDAEHFLWSKIGDAEEHRLSVERAAIVKVLCEADAPMTPAEIAAALGKPANAVRVLLFSMKKDQQVTTDGKRYSAGRPVTAGGEDPPDTPCLLCGDYDLVPSPEGSGWVCGKLMVSVQRP
jgi:hypothetical protein